MAVAKHVDMLAAVRAEHIAHVFHNAKDGNLHHFGHLHSLANDHADQLLRTGYNNDAIYRQGLEHGQRHIAGSRRHIDKQKVNVVPDHFLPELLDRTGNHGAAPHNGGFLIFQQQVDGHDLDAGVAFHRVDAVLGAHGRAMNAEQFGDGRAGNVSIQHADLVAFAAHGNSHHGAGHAFANAALAGNNADHFFDVAFCVRRFMLRRTAGTVSVAVAAIVGTCFTHVGIAPFICAGRGAATAPPRHRSPFCGMGRTLLVYRVRAQNASTIKMNSTPNQQKCPNCMGDTSS